MHFRIVQHFDVPLVSVETALCDPLFIARMAELPRLGRPELIGHAVTGHNVHLQVRYAFAGELSSSVRAVVDPQQLTWIEDSTTDLSTHRAVFRILPDHYASLLRCEGTFELADEGPHACVRVAEGEIKVSVPLVGGKVERAIVSGLEEHAEAEADLVEQWRASGAS